MNEFIVGTIQFLLSKRSCSHWLKNYRNDNNKWRREWKCRKQWDIHSSIYLKILHWGCVSLKFWLRSCFWYCFFYSFLEGISLYQTNIRSNKTNFKSINRHNQRIFIMNSDSSYGVDDDTRIVLPNTLKSTQIIENRFNLLFRTKGIKRVT